MQKTSRMRGLGIRLSVLVLALGAALGSAFADTPRKSAPQDPDARFAQLRSEFTGLDIQTWQTPNGAKVMFVHAPQLPMVDVRVVFDAGSARDGSRPGIANLTNDLLDQGAGKLSADQIAQRFDQVGASFGAGVDRDMATLSLRSLTTSDLLEPALETFKTVLEAPRFDPPAFARERQRVLVALKNLEQDPGDLAHRAFYRHLYADHPYGHTVIGTREAVQGFTPADAQAFYKRYYVARNGLVAIVGDVGKAQARHIAERLVGDLPQGEKPAPLPAPKPLQKAQTVRIPHPSAQTHLLAGQLGVQRGAEDYFPLYVGNHILGGSGFGSRVLEEIREKRGLAYSAYSYFVPLEVPGPFLMGLQTRTKQTQTADRVLMKTLRDFVQEGPTRKELTDAKEAITGGFPLRIDSNSNIIGYLAVIGFYDLPLDYLKTFNKHIEDVTLEQIERAFQQRVHPDRLLTVEVGKQQG